MRRGNGWVDIDELCHAIGSKDHLLVSKYGGHGFWVELVATDENLKTIISLKTKHRRRRRVFTPNQFDVFAEKHELTWVKV